MGRISFKTSVEAIFGFIWDLVLVVLLSLVLNPVVWWLWALIVPKSAVNCLKYTNKKERVMVYCCGYFWFVFASLLIHILPWRSKKCFFHAFPKVKMSDRQQARAYCEGWLKRERLSATAKDIVWKRSAIYWNDLAVGCLTLKQFEDVLSQRDEETLKLHLEVQTPSKDKMETLLKYVAQTQSASLIGIMKKAISKYGLHPELIKQVFFQAQYVTIQDNVMLAIDEYQEVETVKSLDKDIEKWREYLITYVEKELKLPAQRVFTQQQFSLYVAQGKQFNDDLLWEWMNDTVKREWLADYVKTLLKSGKASESVKAFVKADKWWREKLLFRI